MSVLKEILGENQIQEKYSMDESVLESSCVPSNLNSPEYVSSQNRCICKLRMSTTTFKKKLEDQKQDQDSGEISSPLESPENEQKVERLVSKSKMRMPATAFLNVLEKIRNKEEVLALEISIFRDV